MREISTTFRGIPRTIRSNEIARRGWKTREKKKTNSRSIKAVSNKTTTRRKMKHLPDVTEADIVKIAAYPAIFERGQEYYSYGYVQNLRVTDDCIHANIEGNFGQYTIEIELSDGRFISRCDCPFGGPGCKHVVAVLLAYMYESKRRTLPPIGDDPDDLNVLDHRLNQLSKSDLRDLLLYLHKRFPDTRRVIEGKL
jgi:uncharacterized Zn finger protein